MTTFSIAGLQLEGPNGDNVELMVGEIDAIVSRFPWVDMILCPELAACGTIPDAAVARAADSLACFQEVAKQHGIWLVPGSVFVEDGGKVFNEAPIISPDGEIIARHRKLFPFCPYEKGVTAGGQHTVFDVPGIGRFGVSICYDMWFPESIRSLVWAGAEIILHPTLTSTIDRDAERAMIRAHAAQNQCYFFDVNLADKVGVGESLVAGPGGEVIYQAGKGREIFPLKLDLDYLRDVRRNGWHNLGQPLKSFRDSKLTYPQYESDRRSVALDSLGPLKMASRTLT